MATLKERAVAAEARASDLQAQLESAFTSSCSAHPHLGPAYLPTSARMALVRLPTTWQAGTAPARISFFVNILSRRTRSR